MLTNFNSQLMSGEKFRAIEKDKITFKSIERYHYGLEKPVSRKP